MTCPNCLREVEPVPFESSVYTFNVCPYCGDPIDDEQASA